jgi:hypothetical protein
VVGRHDRNVFFRREGGRIRRSSHILVDGQCQANTECPTARDLFRALEGEDAVIIAHGGGSYADVNYTHDGRVERSVEVYSTWGTFEWLLHDAFEKGYRVGMWCSNGCKGGYFASFVCDRPTLSPSA